MLKCELAEMERRNQEAEARHEELTGKLPDATRPLLRQIEGMQRTAAAHAQAWHAAEHALQSRLGEAETQAASASKYTTARNVSRGVSLYLLRGAAGLSWLMLIYLCLLRRPHFSSNKTTRDK